MFVGFSILKAPRPCYRIRADAEANQQAIALLEDIRNQYENAQTKLGDAYAALKRRLGHLNVLGGCGTDHRHIEEISATCVPLFAV